MMGARTEKEGTPAKKPKPSCKYRDQWDNGFIFLQVRGFETNYCIDSMGHTNGGNVETGPCHRMGGNQLFRINEASQLMQYDQCLTKGADGSSVIITHCNLNEYTEWKYFKDLNRFTYIPTGKCLDRSDLLHKVFIADCDRSKNSQKWEMNNIVAV